MYEERAVMDGVQMARLHSGGFSVQVQRASVCWTVHSGMPMVAAMVDGETRISFEVEALSAGPPAPLEGHKESGGDA